MGGGGGGGGGGGPIVISVIPGTVHHQGSNAPQLVETPDALYNFVGQCLNLFVVGPHPPYVTT